MSAHTGIQSFPISGLDGDFKLPDVLPVLPLKETVVFPYVIVPLSVELEKGAIAVDRALDDNRLIMLTARRDPTSPDDSLEALHPVGTVGVIMRMLKLPDGRLRILAQGLTRARMEHLSQTEPYLKARIQRLEPGDGPAEGLEGEALVRNVRDSLEKALHLGTNISPEVMVLAANLDEPGRLADLTASNLDLPINDAQQVLETPDPLERLHLVGQFLLREIELLNMQHEISSRAQGEFDRSQREYFLRQQLKAIQQELGEADELTQEIEGYRRVAEEKQMPKEATEELEKQIRRLERSHPESGENTIIRTYLDWLTGLPWGVRSEDNLQLDHAKQILEEDHYGLDKVKQRIIELLAVRHLQSNTKGPILCFTGPPGVGKTSLGRSIARAMGRKFIRISLGGVRDEAEIRGHRRTYVGSMPGRIIQGLNQAGTCNPIFMLDEIDKLGADYRGDPSAALLEVLDPEQNFSFRDHYLGVSFDLSDVIFITTANLLDPIQDAFLDRMEVIRLSGYTEEEKLTIAHRHLIPKQRTAHGLEEKLLHFTDAGVRKIIRGHTREAGLRNLEREVGAICRKTAVKVAEGRKSRTVINAARVEALLGPDEHMAEPLLAEHRVGVATGLAWTMAGGDLLLIEAIAIPGQGKLQLTGRLGDVMKESAQAALSYTRKYAALHLPELHQAAATKAPDTEAALAEAAAAETAPIKSAPAEPGDFFSRNDLHIHAPAGSIPKDGPSAGITIATALISMLTNRPVHRKIAMTGEITLRGDILPIGGLKEKALAARAAGIKTVIIPKLNERDLRKLPTVVRKDLSFHCLDHMDEVLELVLLEANSESSPKKS